jgi:hypothetical protein
MRHLRIYDAQRALLFDLPNVAGTATTTTGALMIDLDPGQTPELVDEHVTKLVLAPGYWAVVQEVERPDEQPAEPDDAPFTEISSVPFYPGDTKGFLAAISDIPTTGGGQRPPLVPGFEEEPPSEAARVHAAMAVACLCLGLRCPVVLNPSTEAERRSVRLRAKLHLRSTPEPEPLMRCSREVGHDPMTEPHRWIRGEWIYGPAQHHPRCPRHPARYNMPTEEEQPLAARFTSTTELPSAVHSARAMISAPWAPADSAGAPADTLVQEVSARHSAAETVLVRPYANGQHAKAAIAVPVGGWNAPSTFNVAARQIWNLCAVWGPESISCELAKDHPADVLHEADKGGDRIRW